ncbi:uncharacterized protein LOC110716787 [Chenopodium quinoa]|uniref:uncharacterized protein LOC110699536 n=1 Tax=Chenopodium quinoa TaxID=63459 RepID=UPI000B78FCF1|nr:uncharacterized protein LOC110699536 [Chenopodium quinoa]XP_021751107.1 uncharacterized protein LOC110716787 [Chenopodium quinoa]
MNNRRNNSTNINRAAPLAEIESHRVQGSGAYWQQCVYGYLMDYRSLSVQSISSFINTRWRKRGHIEVFKMNDLYVFKCSDDEDKREMLAMTKACFDGALMVFSPWWPNQVPQTVRFRRAKFWIRICGLPCEYLNSHMAKTTGEMLGMPYEIDWEPNFVPRNDYLRICVMINLGEPLIPGFFLKLDDDAIIWIQLRYEHLFKYCTRCGRIGHKYTRCTRHEDLINLDVDHKMMEYLSRGIPTMEA